MHELILAYLPTPEGFNKTNSGLVVPRTPDVLNHAGEIFKQTLSPDGELWLPDSYLSNQSNQTQELPKIVDLAEKRKGRNRFKKLGAFARAAASLAIAALSTASILLYGENQVSADSKEAVNSPVRITEHIEGSDFIGKDTSPSLENTRRAQQARTCRELLVWGHPELSAKESDITAYFFSFPDQPQGLTTYTGSTQYYDLLTSYLSVVKDFAKREVDMNLTTSVVRNPVAMDKPLFGGYKNDKGVNDQNVLVDAAVAKLSIPVSLKRSDKLLILLINPNTDASQIQPYPGFSSGLGNEYSTGLMPSLIFHPGYQIAGPNAIAHEDVYHGVLGNFTHNDDPGNPNPDLLSVARSVISISTPLMSLKLADWDVRDLCQNSPVPTFTPTFTPTRTSTPVPTFTPTPISVTLTRRVVLPLTARRSSA